MQTYLVTLQQDESQYSEVQLVPDTAVVKQAVHLQIEVTYTSCTQSLRFRVDILMEHTDRAALLTILSSVSA